MNSATDYLALAIVLALRSVTASRGLPRNRAGVIEEFEGRYNWRVDAGAAEKALRRLEQWGFLSISNDKYAGELLRFTRLSSDETLVRYMPNEIDELFSKARLGGAAWFRDVFNNQQFWEDLYRDPLPEVVGNEDDSQPIDSADELSIPASDRIVRADDNRSSIDLLSADLRGISEEIRGNNEASIELGDEKDIITGEIAAAEMLIAQPAFRLSRLYALVLPALRFLAEKFATGAIGEMAKRIIALLFGFA